MNSNLCSFLYYSRAADYKSIPITQSKPSGTYKPIPPPKPKNYRPPQAMVGPIENNGNDGSNSYQHSKSYSIATSHVHNGVIIILHRIPKLISSDSIVHY